MAASPVFAASDSKPGAVKADLMCTNAAGDVTVVGWVIADTNAKGDGMINLEIHADDLAPNETYVVRAGDPDKNCDEMDVELGTLTTNGQGNGNAHFRGAPGDIPQEDSLTFKVCVNGCYAVLTVQLK